jgi:hypothetical protein
MPIPAHVTFKGLAPRSDVESLIHQEIAGLGNHYGRIVDCRIRIEVPHRHHTSGNPVHVLIELAVPGDRLVVDHVAEPHEGASDGAGSPKLCAAVREAFIVVQRQLADYADRQRHGPRPRRTAVHI